MSKAASELETDARPKDFLDENMSMPRKEDGKRQVPLAES
jgi:hypothetical protein